MDDLIDNIPCGFLVFDGAGEILFANATLRRMLGYGRNELEHCPIDNIFTVASRIFHQTHFFPLLKLQGHAEEIYLTLKLQSGGQIPVLANALCRTIGDATVYDCVFMVVHQRSLFEDEILAARKAAELASQEAVRAYEELAGAHAKLEEQAVELEAQAVELEAQQDELIRLNSELEQDLSVRRVVEKQLRALIARETLISDIGRTVRESPSADAILRRATSVLGEALKVDRCFFTQYDRPHNRHSIELDWRLPGLPSIAGEYDSFADDASSTLYRSLSPLKADDVETGGDISRTDARALRAVGLRSAIGVGLFDRDQLVGALTVGMANAPRSWTENEVALVQAVATQVRSAMEAVRVRQRERNIASRLQDALRPSSPDRLPGLAIHTEYRPALDEAEVGGDFFDVFPVSGSRYALVVADVSGKGLQAAAQTAGVRHMLRAMVYQDRGPLAEAMMALNTMLADHDLLSGFATLFVGIYDAEGQTLEYVSCGQEPGLVRRSDCVEHLKATGPVLGSIAGMRYTSRTIPLSAGDVMAFFTDGLTEAGVRRAEMLEIEGVEEIFRASTDDSSASPRQIVSRMMTAVIDRVTPAGLRDDVCLLVARVG